MCGKMEPRRLNNPLAIEPCKQILEWAEKTPGVSIKWTGGPVFGGFFVVTQCNGSDVLFTSVEIGPKGEGVRGYFQYSRLRKVPPFTDQTIARRAVDELNEIGLSLQTDTLDDGKERYPGFSLTPLQDNESMQQFLKALESIVEQIQTAPETTPKS